MITSLTGSKIPLTARKGAITRHVSFQRHLYLYDTRKIFMGITSYVSQLLCNVQTTVPVFTSAWFCTKYFQEEFYFLVSFDHTCFDFVFCHGYAFVTFSKSFLCRKSPFTTLYWNYSFSLFHEIQHWHPFFWAAISSSFSWAIT